MTKNIIMQWTFTQLTNFSLTHNFNQPNLFIDFFLPNQIGLHYFASQYAVAFFAIPVAFILNFTSRSTD